MTWHRGRELVTDCRIDMEGPLAEFLTDLYRQEPQRVPGIAVFPHPNSETTPLALRANLTHNHVLHQSVIIISGRTADTPHIPWPERLTLTPLGARSGGVTHIAATFGFQDRTDFPEVLRRAASEHASLLGEDGDPDQATYFLSRVTLHRTERPGLARWRKALFIGMAHNAASQAEFLHLPTGHTVTVSADVSL
jgi:KUP system potassium uptake protein